MKALVFDTETSGLTSSRLRPLKSQPEVIEFYGAIADLSVDPPIVLEELNLLIKPSKPISEEITEITKITNTDLEHAPSFATSSDLIRGFIEKSPAVIAHNASFDVEIIDMEFERLGQKINWPRIICTVEQTVFLKGFRLKLPQLYQLLFNEEFKDAHRAIADTTALLRCCGELVRRDLL